MNQAVTIRYNIVGLYSQLEYTAVVEADTCAEEPCFTAVHPELPGCRGQGRTPAEAVSDLAAARYDYIASLIEDGLEVPLPQSANKFVSVASTWHAVSVA